MILTDRFSSFIKYFSG